MSSDSIRRSLGVAVMVYKAILGLSEIVVGLVLAIPSFDPQATFARLSAEELRKDPRPLGGEALAVFTPRERPEMAARAEVTSPSTSSAAPRTSPPRNGRVVSKTTSTQRGSRARWPSFPAPSQRWGGLPSSEAPCQASLA